MDKVYWMDFHAGPGCSLEDKFVRVLNSVGLGTIAGKGELVAVKVHVGEKGNLAYVNHNYARLAAEKISACGAKPFFTDTNTLYSGTRHNAVDHSLTALLHGYSPVTAGAPFIVADGLRGLDFEDLPINGKHFRNARIGSALCKADKLVVLSHFKGHSEMGFGGAIKNMGMGCAAVPGKLELHSSSKPQLIEASCVGCQQCVRCCPAGAVVVKNKKAEIDFNACIGCGQCVAACNYGAMNVKWESHGETLLEKVGEYAAALNSRFAGKACYINFAQTISPDCDCWNFNDAPFVQDVGIFASLNPLALDHATLDCVNNSPVIANGPFAGAGKSNNNVFDGIHQGVRSGYIFNYCRKFGMDDAYELEKVK